MNIIERHPGWAILIAIIVMCMAETIADIVADNLLVSAVCLLGAWLVWYGWNQYHWRPISKIKWWWHTKRHFWDKPEF